MPENEFNSRQRGWRGRAARCAITLTATSALMTLAVATPALASGGSSSGARSEYQPAVQLVVVTPGSYDVAGAGGVFNVDIALVAHNGTGNFDLSAANGYKPGVNAKPGIGQPDPFAPGLVVLLSTTPQAAGGPHANLAGVFQLTDVANSHGHNEVFADWEVGKPGAFGDGTQVTLLAFLERGTAPGTVSGQQTAISNVVRETFTIGS
jgi:hypothetical protein